MRKTIITVKDIIEFLNAIDGNTLIDALRVFDPEMTNEKLHYLHSRLNFHKKHSDSAGKAGAQVIIEENTTNIADALGVLMFVGLFYGRQQVRASNEQRDDKVKQVLDRLATELGGSVDVIKVDMGNVEGVLKKTAFKKKQDEQEGNA